MNFFDLDSATNRLVASSMIWIYVISSLALTGATFVLYYFLLQRDGRLFTRLEPTVEIVHRASQWNILRKQFTNRPAHKTEKDESEV